MMTDGKRNESVELKHALTLGRYSSSLGQGLLISSLGKIEIIQR